MEGPTSSWGSRNRLTCLTLQEHDDDDDDDYVRVKVWDVHYPFKDKETQSAVTKYPDRTAL